MLLAEEFLLMCLDDETGRKSIADEKLDPALAAAVLVELALLERIGITADDQGWRQRGRVRLTDTKPTDDAVLDDTLAYVEESEHKRQQAKVADLISPTSRHRITKGLRQRLLTRLAAAGVLSEHRGRALGLFPHTTWPTVNSGPEADIRARLRGALVHGVTPTERTAALVALLHATGHVARALPGEDKRLVRQRAKELAEGDWAAKAVRQALDAMTAVMVAAVAGATAGGS